MDYTALSVGYIAWWTLSLIVCGLYCTVCGLYCLSGINARLRCKLVQIWSNCSFDNSLLLQSCTSLVFQLQVAKWQWAGAEVQLLAYLLQPFCGRVCRSFVRDLEWCCRRSRRNCNEKQARNLAYPQQMYAKQSTGHAAMRHSSERFSNLNSLIKFKQWQ